MILLKICLRYLPLAVMMLNLPYSQAAASNQYQLLLSQGEQRLSGGHLDAALDYFQQAATIKPDTETIQQKLAGVYLLRGDYSNSIKHFQNALGFNPQNYRAFIGMAMAYIHTGHYALAEAALNEAKNLNSNNEKDIETLIEWLTARRN